MEFKIVMKRVLWVNLLGLFFSLLTFSVSYADDAEVLPKGRWRLSVDSQFSLPITQRFNKDGKLEDLAKDFNVTINSNVFNELTLLEAGFLLSPGTGNLGRTTVSFRRRIDIVSIQPAYGITDSFSVGVNIPYYWQKIDVQAGLDSSGATIGFNPAGPGGFAPLTGPLASFFPGTQQPTIEDIQDILVSRGFKRVASESNQGLGDIEAGGRYQYFKSENWRLAFTGGARFPTANEDDPDDLVDNTLGYGGEYAILARLNQDFIYQKPGVTKELGVPDAGSFFINTTFRYDYFIRDKQELRVCDIHTPICPDKDNVTRKIGDIVEAELSANIGLLTGFYITPLYKYGHKFKDHYSKGNDVLSPETDYNEHIAKVGLSYTTLPLFMKKQFPVPLTGTIFYKERFAGDNNNFNSKYIGAVLQAFF